MDRASEYIPLEDEERKEFERLLKKDGFDRQLYNMVYKSTRNSAVAEDIVSEAGLRACRGFGTFDRSRSFKNWMFRIAANIIIDLHRRKNRCEMISLEGLTTGVGRDGEDLQCEIPDIEADPARQVVDPILPEKLELALKGLPTDYRIAIILADIEGESYEAIAKTMRCPTGTIRSRLHRGRALLREALGGPPARPSKKRQQTTPTP